MKIRLVCVAFVAGVLCLGPTAAQDCKHVNATSNLTDFLVGPENCDGFDYCLVARLTGNPNGEMRTFCNNAETFTDLWATGDPINTYLCEERIYTRRGEVRSRAYGQFDLSTGLFTELLVVTGGTGEYDGAFGRMLFYTRLPLSATNTTPADGPVELRGTVCTSEEARTLSIEPKAREVQPLPECRAISGGPRAPVDCR